MITRGTAARRQGRSQLTSEMALTLAAIALALIVARLVLHLVNADPLTWSRRLVDLASLPFVWPLLHVPGGSHPLLGEATVADFTVVALAVLALIALGARRRRS